VTETVARRSNHWLVLAVLLAIYIVNFADRYLITGLIGPIKAEFGLGDTFMGLLMGPAFIVLYVFMGVPIARLADRSSRIRIIAAGCVLWSLATIATGLATGPVSLALSRVAVGVGEAAFVAPAYSLMADYFRPEKRGIALAILGLATYFGQMLGQGGGPAIAALTSWRFAFWSIGALGVVLGLLALAVVREPERERLADSAPPRPDFKALVRMLVASPAMLLITAAMSLGMLSGVAFGYWAPELYARSFSLDPVTVKSAFAVNFGLAGLAGMFAFGLLSDRLSRRGMHWPVRLAGLAIGSATLFVLLATWAPDFATVGLLAIPSGLLGGGWSVGLHATVQTLLPASIRASGTALYIAVATLVGQIAGPFAVGLVSDRMGGDAEALQLALTFVIPLGFLGAVCALLAARHVVADRERLALLA
jgi:MFS family permease